MLGRSCPRVDVAPGGHDLARCVFAMTTRRRSAGVRRHARDSSLSARYVAMGPPHARESSTAARGKENGIAGGKADAPRAADRGIRRRTPPAVNEVRINDDNGGGNDFARGKEGDGRVEKVTSGQSRGRAILTRVCHFVLPGPTGNPRRRERGGTVLRETAGAHGFRTAATRRAVT